MDAARVTRRNFLWTHEKNSRLIALVMRGATWPRLAKLFGCPPETVRKQVVWLQRVPPPLAAERLNGASAPLVEEKARDGFAKLWHTRHMRRVDGLILERVQAGATYAAIGQELGLPHRKIYHICRRLGIKATRPPSQLRADTAMLERDQQIVGQVQSGVSLAVVGRQFGITGERVRQICKQYDVFSQTRRRGIRAKRRAERALRRSQLRQEREAETKECPVCGQMYSRGRRHKFHWLRQVCCSHSCGHKWAWLRRRENGRLTSRDTLPVMQSAVAKGGPPAETERLRTDLARLKYRMERVAEYADAYDGDIAGAIRDALNLDDPHWSEPPKAP